MLVFLVDVVDSGDGGGFFGESGERKTVYVFFGG